MKTTNNRFIRICFVFAMMFLALTIFNPITADAAYQAANQSKAEALQELGLVKGSEKGFELDRAPTRVECSVMLVRLLGKEAEAQTMHYSHPFKDVPSWADDYVGFLYKNGYTNGIGNNLFGSDQLMSANAYSTFVLRALGYNDNAGDFTWNISLEKSKEAGIINEDYYNILAGKNAFLRDDLMGISYGCLSAVMNHTDKSLISMLVDSGAVDSEKASQLKLTESSIMKTKVTLYDYDGTFHKIKVDYDTLPEKMKKFNQIMVVGERELSDAYAALIQKRVKEGKDILNTHNKGGSNGTFGSYLDIPMRRSRCSGEW